MSTVTIDAKDQVLGRLASRIAITLRGKHLPSWRPDRLPDVTVVVKNADQYRVSGRKRKQKKYYRFSGYPGGLSSRRLEEIKPTDALMMAVRRMLPPNRSRQRLLKRLVLDNP